MNPDPTPTPRTDAHYATTKTAWPTDGDINFARQLERELTEKTNEVERHCEKLQKLRLAAQAVVDRWETPLWKEAEPTAAVIYRLRDALAPAPDKPVTEKSSVVQPEWRELGPLEVIQKGDEYISKQKAVWYEIDDEFENTMVKQWPTNDWPYCQFRTRRSLPVQPVSDCMCNNPSIITASHNGKTYDQCSKCGKKFKEPVSLDTATKITHEGNNPIQN